MPLLNYNRNYNLNTSHLESKFRCEKLEKITKLNPNLNKDFDFKELKITFNALDMNYCCLILMS